MKVLQLIDSLHAGGAERVAVNFANALASKIDKSFICTTRDEGVLKMSIGKNVGYLFLNKKRAIDIKAIKRLNNYIKLNDINIIHAHSTSFFLATIIKCLNKKIKIVWHDHYGSSEFLDKRKSNVLKFCSIFFSHIFSVNRNLEIWGKKNLLTKNIDYLPNFAIKNDVESETTLFGKDGKRIICLANLRPQKDHFTLVNAFKRVKEKYPDWTLHCVGKDFNDEYSKNLKREIEKLNLTKDVYLYGSKPDVSNILNQSKIGVLSSKSEGLPIALLEYGLGKLAVITTKVGECENVIETNDFGVLVNAENIEELINAFAYLIENEEESERLALNFNRKVIQQYSVSAILDNVITIYNRLS